MRTGLQRLWRKMWRNAPRQLRFTRAGRVIVGVALATGFAAINTGNNLLFLGWGLVLSAIVVSGILSEATLRKLTVMAVPPKEPRAGQPLGLPLRLVNQARRFAALGLEVRASLRGPLGDSLVATAPFVLRLSAAATQDLRARCSFTRRGKYMVDELAIETAYPFGFFLKSKPFVSRTPLAFWVAPRQLDVTGLALELFSRRGDAPAHAAGHGDDYFAMRDFRDGDDPRRIKWRRSARTGRWVVVEHEAMAGEEVVLELAVPAELTHVDDRTRERAIEVVGSLAELLLARGLRVGLRGPGTDLPTAAGPAQAWNVLLALAALDPRAAVPTAPVGPNVTLIAVCTPGVAVTSRADRVVEVDRDEAREVQAA